MNKKISYSALLAFSLVELMISLITISLIAAAFAPVITKKLSKNNITVGSFGGGGGGGGASLECSGISDCILCKDKVILKNIPNLSDIHNMCEILRTIGCEVVEKQDQTIINSKNINSYVLPSELTNKLRASIFLLGPL